MALALRLTSSSRVGFQNITRTFLQGQLAKGTASSTNAIKEQARKEMVNFWAKNKALGRPFSPHLTIYKGGLPMNLSLIHRVSGTAMGVVWVFLGCSAVAFSGQYKDIVDWVKQLDLGSPIVSACKWVLAFPLVYHSINGVRHISWDRALGMTLPAIYKTGYSVFFVSLCVTTALCLYKYHPS